ncbi:hypothetical protein [Streptomyces sp. NPDC058572]|uniref:hypothetical protein n=1 Tax=Streptomyces sp. NPDC058572 TaxID=3346546 RepID=UPI00365DD88C
MAQVVGTVSDRPADAEARPGAASVRGTLGQWARPIARLATEQPFRTFVFWPERSTTEQIHRFAHDAVPVARALLAKPWTMAQEAR